MYIFLALVPINYRSTSIFLFTWMDRLNSFTNNKFFTLVQIESICRRQYKCARKKETFLGGAENIVGKGENSVYQHFLIFPQCFQKASFTRSLKVGILWQRVNLLVYLASEYLTLYNTNKSNMANMIISLIPIGKEKMLVRSTGFPFLHFLF